MDWIGGPPDETDQEKLEDSCLGVCFLILTLWSGYRLALALPALKHSIDRGGGRVIASFYSLIFITSFLRSAWFLIPTEFLEGSYVPVAKKAYSSHKWVGVFVSEVLLALGSMFLFSIFILIAAFWAHMLRRVDGVDEIKLHINEKEGGNREDDKEEEGVSKQGPLHNFALMMAALVFTEGVNFVLFLLRFYDSEGMLLYDSILLSIISLATLIEFTIFSSRIQHVLKTISAVNANSTTMQRNRIISITTAANIFFVIHFIVEGALSGSLVLAWHQGRSFDTVLQKAGWWELYIRLKHWSEVIVLIMALMVSLPSGDHVNSSMNRRDYEAIPDAEV